MGPSEFRRDGQILSAPDYGGDDTDADQRDDVVEGELAPPATMIGHETVAIEEPEPAVVERAMRIAQHEHRNGVTPSRIAAMQRFAQIGRRHAGALFAQIRTTGGSFSGRRQLITVV